jgi:hypothetical protein
LKASPEKPATRTDLTQAYLRELLIYNQNTGQFVWRSDRNKQVLSGHVAGHVKPDGYRVIVLHSRHYGAHRLAWLYMMGDWPEAEIDHINQNRDDNRWCNLRAASRQLNNFNVSSSPRPDNKSGIKGVRFWAKNRKWHARIQYNKVSHHLGYFDTEDDARQAYISAAAALGRYITPGPS